MASAFSHAFVAVALGSLSRHPAMDRRALLLGAFCAVLPDIDVIGFGYGIEYGDLWGHRGMTHSLFFAALVGIMVAALCYRNQPKAVMAWMSVYCSLSMASHGLLDALTDGGLGVAFFSPLDPTRYFFPLRPIAVSPIGLREFFGEQGLRVMESELLWIGLPTAALFILRRALNAACSGVDHPK